MSSNQTISKTQLWTSYILQGLVSLMLMMGAVMNLTKSETAVKGATDMGFSESSMTMMGLTLLTAVLLYVYPKTSTFGAVLLTAWLGGAVATHIIHHDSMGMMCVPIIFGIVVWVALWLRNGSLRQVFPMNA